MEESPNSANSWPLEYGLGKPSSLVEAHALTKVPALVGTFGVPSKAKGPDLGKFPLGDIQSKLSKMVLDKLRCKFQILLEFKLEVPLPIDQVSNPPPGRIMLYEDCLKARI